MVITPASVAAPRMAEAAQATRLLLPLAIMIAITCSDLPEQRSVGPAFVLAQFWPGRSHRGGANVLFCDAHVDYGNQGKWIERTDRARRRWNNDHEPHPGVLR